MKFSYILAVIVVAAVAAVGCSTSSELQRAQLSYSDARNDPMVSQNGSEALNDAGMALEKAENARSWDEEIHYAYIAQRNVELARLQSSHAETNMEAARLERDREQLYADLSQQEAEQARQDLRGYRARSQQELLDAVNNPLFGFDEAQLRPEDRRRIDQLSEFLKENPDRGVLVEGFTDNIGSEDYNKQLGQRRADAIAQELQTNGISPERITTRGIGEALPIVPNDTAEGRQQNRRAVITILNQEQ